jgi:hypothetical protein
VPDPVARRWIALGIAERVGPKKKKAKSNEPGTDNKG